MSARQPPRFATWLALHLLSGRRRDSLVGDLLERYGERPSNGWYWRQVLLAIVASATRDVAEHKVLALRALLVGWTLYYVSAEIVIRVLPTVRTWVGHWTPASFWADHIPFSLLVDSACAMSGWLVARLHRRTAVGMVSLFAGSVFLLVYGTIVWRLLAQPAPPWVVPPRDLVIIPLLTIGQPLGVVLGGLWGASQNPDASPAGSVEQHT